MTLVWLAAAWVAGILLASTDGGNFTGWIIIGGVALLSALVMRDRPTVRLALLMVMMAAFGAARYIGSLPVIDETHIAYYNDTGYFELEGVISAEPDPRDTHFNLRVAMDTLRDGDLEVTVHGVALVQAPRSGDYAYGDRVEIWGRPSTPPTYDTFSYRDYLARHGILTLVPDARVTVLGSGYGNPVIAAMLQFKARARSVISAFLPDPQGALLTGILLGDESGISPDVGDAFAATGTTHIIAISGFNIAIVAGLMMGLARKVMAERYAAMLTIVGIAFYAALVGGDPAVVRAAIMGGLGVIAARIGRQTYALSSMAAAALVMSLLNPQVIWDVGFQLSFAATLGLVLYTGRIEEGIRRLLRGLFAAETVERVIGALSEPVIVTLAAQITTLPLLVLYFRRLSLVSLFANALILPAQSLVMVIGGLATLIGLVVFQIGRLFAWADWLFLTYTIEVVRVLSRLPWAEMDVAVAPVAAWGMYPLLMGVMEMVSMPGERIRKLADAIRRRIGTEGLMGAGAVVAALLWAVAMTGPDGLLWVRFPDVGDGNAVLIQTPGGAHVLIDGGRYPTRTLTALGGAIPFWNRRVDLVLVTGPGDDRVLALPDVLAGYEVQLVGTSGVRSESPSWAAFEDAVAREGAGQVTLLAGDEIRFDDGVTITVIHPQELPGEDSKPADYALALRLSYGDASFLLLPDWSRDAVDEVLRAGWYISGTVMQVAGYGRASANPPELLAAVSPQVAVLNVGAGNRAGLPDEGVLDALSGVELFRTDRHGTLALATDGATLWVYTER